MPCSSGSSDMILEYVCSNLPSAFLWEDECWVQGDGDEDCANGYSAIGQISEVSGCGDSACYTPPSPSPSTPTTPPDTPTTPTTPPDTPTTPPETPTTPTTPPDTPTTPSDTPTSPSDTPTSPTPTGCEATVIGPDNETWNNNRGPLFKPSSNSIDGDGEYEITYRMLSIVCEKEGLCPDDACGDGPGTDCAYFLGIQTAGGSPYTRDDFCECSEELIPVITETITTHASTDCTAPCVWSETKGSHDITEDCSIETTHKERDCCDAASTPGSCSGGGTCSNPGGTLYFTINTIESCETCESVWGSDCSTEAPPTDLTPSTIEVISIGDNGAIAVIDFSGGEGTAFQTTTAGRICVPAGFCYSQSIDVYGDITCDGNKMSLTNGEAIARSTDAVCTTYNNGAVDAFCGGNGNVSGMAAIANGGLCQPSPGAPPYGNTTCALTDTGGSIYSIPDTSISLDSVGSMRSPDVQAHCLYNPSDPCCKKINAQMDWVTNARNCKQNPNAYPFCDKYAGCPPTKTEKISASLQLHNCDTTYVDYKGVCYTNNYS